MAPVNDEAIAALERLRAKSALPPVAADNADTTAKPATYKARRVWKPTFLAAYADRGSVKDAAQIAGIARQTAYEHRLKDLEFAAAWDAIDVDVVTLLEAAVLERALAGSDRLAEFLLKAHRPTMYRDSLRIDGKITVVNEAQLDEEIEDFLAREREELDAASEGEATGDAGVPIVDAPSAPAAAPAI